MSDGPLVKRDARGRLLPGYTVNPGGRPREVRELCALARSHVPDALAFAARLLGDERKDDRVRLEAAKFLAAYGLGTPPKLNENDPDETLRQLRALTDHELRARARACLDRDPDAQRAFLEHGLAHLDSEER